MKLYQLALQNAEKDDINLSDTETREKVVKEREALAEEELNRLN